MIAPTGQYISAQGNALGKKTTNTARSEGTLHEMLSQKKEKDDPTRRTVTSSCSRPHPKEYLSNCSNLLQSFYFLMADRVSQPKDESPFPPKKTINYKQFPSRKR